MLGSKFPSSEILRQEISEADLLLKSSSESRAAMEMFFRINSLFAWRASYLSYCHKAPCTQPKISSRARVETVIRRRIKAILDLTYFALFAS